MSVILDRSIVVVLIQVNITKNRIPFLRRFDRQGDTSASFFRISQSFLLKAEFLLRTTECRWPERGSSDQRPIEIGQSALSEIAILKVVPGPLQSIRQRGVWLTQFAVN